MPTLPPAPALPEIELALLKAAYSGDLQKVQSLVGKGVDINVQSHEFYDMGSHQKVTPLMCAADRGHLELVRWLLGHKANHASETVLTKSEGGPGTQALHFAAAEGHEAVIDALLDAGANPNAQGKFGRTPLTSALGEGKLACAKLLLARGASGGVTSKNKSFEPPLVVLASAAANTTSLVARNGKLVPAAKDLWDQKEMLFEVFQTLLSAGADPNATGSSRESPLHLLARQMPDDIRRPIAHLLLEKGANPDALGSDGYSPLVTAALYDSCGYARLLLEHSATLDVNRIVQRGTVLDIVESNIKTARRDIVEARTNAIRADFEAQLCELQAFLELLKTRGGKRKSQLAVAPDPAIPEVRHVASDFLKLVNSGEPEWALLAVKAPFAEVSDAYLKFAKGKSRQEKVVIRPAADAEEIPRVAAVVKVKDSPWTLIVRTIFYIRSPDIQHVTDAARELSKSLKTRALSYVGTDESENGECELFGNGKSLEMAGEEECIALLTREKIPLPACYPAKGPGKTWLSVEKPSFKMVERADLIAR